MGIEISADEDLITPERRKKGDLDVALNLKGKVSRAIPAQLSVIKELIRRGTFPYHYEIYGVGFLELRNAFRAPWASRSSAVLLEQWGVGVSNSKADNIYQAVCRGLGVPRIELIIDTLERVERRKVKGAVGWKGGERRANRLELQKLAFDKLIELMDTEREELIKKMNGG